MSYFAWLTISYKIELRRQNFTRNWRKMCLGGCLTAWFPLCVEDRKKNRGRKRNSSGHRDSRRHRRSQRRSHSRNRPSRSSLRNSRTVEDLDHTLDELGLPGLQHRKSNLSVSKNSSEISQIGAGRISTSNNQNTLRSSRVSKTAPGDSTPRVSKTEQELRKIRDSRRNRQHGFAGKSNLCLFWGSPNFSLLIIIFRWVSKKRSSPISRGTSTWRAMCLLWNWVVTWWY